MIPAFKQIDTEDIYTIPIIDDGSALYAVTDRPFLRVRAAYYEQKIKGAIATCFLRPEVLSRLERVAHDIERQTGWHMLILDGWRPTAVQQELYEDIFRAICKKYPQESEAQHHHRTLEFVALPSKNPLRPSPHLTGGSVDVALCDADGKLIDMGSGFDEPTTRSYTDAYEHQAGPIRERRRLLYEAMIKEGFTNLPTEWWHYDFGNQNWAYFSGNAQAIYGPTYPDSY